MDAAHNGIHSSCRLPKEAISRTLAPPPVTGEADWLWISVRPTIRTDDRLNILTLLNTCAAATTTSTATATACICCLVSLENVQYFRQDERGIVGTVNDSENGQISYLWNARRCVPSFQRHARWLVASVSRVTLSANKIGERKNKQIREKYTFVSLHVFAVVEENVVSSAFLRRWLRKAFQLQ